MKLPACFFLLMTLTFCFYPVSAFAAHRELDGDYEQKWRHFLNRDAAESAGKAYPFDACFQEAARESNLPVSLLLAVARGESFFDPRAESNRQCYGIMQIRWPETAHHLGVRTRRALYDPCTNIKAGARYLRELLTRYDGSLHLALAAYNYGPGRIPRQGTPGEIPAGARWYSGYIYHHLESVLRRVPDPSRSRPFTKPSGRKKVIVFNRPFRAKGFLGYLKNKAPGVRLAWFRIGKDRFQVVMLYDNEEEMTRGKRKLNRLGIPMT